jgi:4-aminobutyrate aminotransferase-like enzyme/Ser/Thr protein kinase RdoA (MazF antagonist)
VFENNFSLYSTLSFLKKTKTMDFTIAESPNPVIGEEEAKELLSQHYSSLVCTSLIHVSRLDSERDANFHVKVSSSSSSSISSEYILKFANSKEPTSETELQTAVLQHLDATLLRPSSPSHTPTLLVPQAVACPSYSSSSVFSFPYVSKIDGRTSSVRLLTFVPGVPLRSRLTKNSPNSRLRHHMGVSLATLDISLRGFFHPPSASRLLYWDIAHSDLLTPLLQHISNHETHSLIETHLNNFISHVKPRLLHLRHQAIFNDFNPDNVLVSSSSSDMISGVIDFGDLVHGTLAAEVAVAAAYLFFSCKEGEIVEDPISAVCDLLRGFVSVLPLEPLEIDLLLDLIKMRFVITVIITSWRCFLHPQNSDYVLRWNHKALTQLHRVSEFDPVKTTLLFYQASSLSFHLSSYSSSSSSSSTSSSSSPFSSITTSVTEQSLLNRREAVLPPSYRLFYKNPVQVMSGSGSELMDESGRRYVDCYNNVASVGHCNPKVLKAVCTQLSTLNTHTRYLHPAVVELSERLLQTLPRPLHHCFYTCSGSEANDLAYRLASTFTFTKPEAEEKEEEDSLPGVICTQYAYHGGTFITSSFTPCYTLAMGRKVPSHIELLDIVHLLRQEREGEGKEEVVEPCEAVFKAVQALKSRKIRPAMLILDCGLTSDGVHPVTAKLLRSIMLACKESGILFLADEVQVGFGRTGRIGTGEKESLWGFENILERTSEETEKQEFVPDIVTMGKPMANGFPMGCVITRRLVEEKDNTLSFSPLTIHTSSLPTSTSLTITLNPLHSLVLLRSDITEQFAKDWKYFNTFGGNPVASKACLAVLDVIEKEELSKYSKEMGDYLLEQLKKVQKEHPKIAR